MLVRIFLILAILIAIAATIIGLTQVKPKIEAMRDSLVEETEKRGQQTKRANTAEKDRDAEKAAKEAEMARHRATRNQLQNTENQLAAANDRIGQLNGQISKLKADLLAAQQDLGAWEALGIPVNKIKDMIAELNETKLKVEELQGVNKNLSQKLTSASNYIAILLGQTKFDDEEGIPLPSDLRARVVGVDPKWNFVVLDVGSAQEAREGGNMLIYRDGKLIAKVKIRSVSENSCVATIMSGWNLVDVQEGDQALHRPAKKALVVQ